MKELTLVTVQSQLTKQQKLLVNEETLAEINKLAADPEYGEEFLDSYLDHLNVLAEAPRNTHSQYLNAVKFFSLVEAGNSLTDAYIKVFPERYEQAKRSNRDPESGKEIVRGNASRYSSSKMVNEIRRVATIPVQLIYRHILHAAILDTAVLATTAKSEMVRQKANEVLIKELKPPEDAVLQIKVDDGTKSVIEELRNAAQTLAAKQYEAIQAGVPLKEIAGAKIYTPDPDDVIEGKSEVVDD